MPFLKIGTLKFINSPIFAFASLIYVKICASWILKQLLDAFQFNDQLLIDQQINSITAI